MDLRLSAFCALVAAACIGTALCGCQSASFEPQTSDPTSQGLDVTSTPVPSYPNEVRSSGTFSPQAGTAYLYIANQNRNEIDIFPLEGNLQPQVGTITAGVDGPYGLWFDTRAQTLYVANQSNNSVTVYSYGSTTPARTYTKDLERPLYPIVDRNGNLYVSNGDNGTVVEFSAGSTSACRVLKTPGIETDGLAFDQKGNLYVAYRTSNGPTAGGIEMFAPGSSVGQVIGMTLDEPQGVVLDTSGNIVVSETGPTDRIDVFPPASQTASLEVPMPQPSSSHSVATELVIDCNEQYLYVSALYSGIVFGAEYPLPGQSLFVKDQVSAIIQGTTITDNQNF